MTCLASATRGLTTARRPSAAARRWTARVSSTISARSTIDATLARRAGGDRRARAPSLARRRAAAAASRRRATAADAANDADDEPAVGKSSFDPLADMEADIARLAADSPLAKEAAAAKEAGVALKTDAQVKMDGIKEAIDTFLLYDFFVILFILAWLVVGVVVRLSAGNGLSYDEPFLGAWLFLWPFLFQPLLGVHMLATIVSPIIGKLKDRGLVSKDTWT
jgi:hypothetical protein